MFDLRHKFHLHLLQNASFCASKCLGQVLQCITITHGVRLEHQNLGSPLHHKQKMFGDTFLHSYITRHLYFINNILVIIYINLQLYKANIQRD